MIRVEAKVEINKPSDEVFAFISNFEHNPQWQSGQIEARFTSEEPLLKMMVQRSVDADYRNLKQILESEK